MQSHNRKRLVALLGSIFGVSATAAAIYFYLKYKNISENISQKEEVISIKATPQELQPEIPTIIVQPEPAIVVPIEEPKIEEKIIFQFEAPMEVPLEKIRNRKPFLIASASILGLALIAVGIWNYNRRRKNKPHQIFPFMLDIEMNYAQARKLLIENKNSLHLLSLPQKKKFLQDVFPSSSYAQKIYDKFNYDGVQYWKSKKKVSKLTNNENYENFFISYFYNMYMIHVKHHYRNNVKDELLQMLKHHNINIQSLDNLTQNSQLQEILNEITVKFLNAFQDIIGKALTNHPEQTFITQDMSRIDELSSKYPDIPHNQIVLINSITVTSCNHNKSIKNIISDANVYLKEFKPILEKKNKLSDEDPNLGAYLDLIIDLLFYKTTGIDPEELYAECHNIVNDKAKLRSLNEEQTNDLIYFFILYNNQKSI